MAGKEREVWTMTNFKIIVPMFNVEKWIKINIEQLKKQRLNFDCVLIDDMSIDETPSIVNDLIKDDSRFQFVINSEKKFALRNIFEGIQKLDPKDDDVILTVDGDDWLYDEFVLNVLNDVYSYTSSFAERPTRTLLTYGSYIEFPTKRHGLSQQISKDVIKNNSFRKAQWSASHLRTFKFLLWKNIKTEDLKDKEGNFYRMAWDQAFMFPMLEMAAERSTFISSPLYIYNVMNPLNDHKIDHSLQLATESEIRNKEPYERLS